MRSMNILNLEHVTKAFANRTILDDITVGIGDRDKIGLIGVNGTGKSTLLAIAAGVMEADSGQVVRGGKVRISYLSQNPVFDEKKNLLDNVVAAVRGREGYWDIMGEVRAMLLRFGLEDPEADPAVLSGGQRKRAALVAALLTPANLLILDEPTNHLDYEMVEWLQNYLKSYRGAILMVTHDRYFLDAVTDQILEIDRANSYCYETNYTGYLERKQARLDDAAATERKMAALYKKDLAWMQRGARARSTKQKAHIQRFEALRDRDPLVEERRVQISALSSRLGGKTILLDGISKSYGEHRLFYDVSYHFNRNDRIGIVGSNGCGKSTLLRTILGQEMPDTGEVEIGQTVQFGYFSQENEELDESLRVIDYVREQADNIRTPEGLVSASNMCERFLFDSQMQYAPIARLSGGEKRRLCLLRVLMAAPNVLILDEPTNDLDIQTLQVLEDYLDQFAGILIVVSHDRYFLDRVVTRVLYFRPDGSIGQSEGGYREYKERLRAAGKALVAGNTDGNLRTGTVGRDSYGSQAVGLPGQKTGEEDAPFASAGNSGEKKSRESWKKPRVRTKLSYAEQREYDSITKEIEVMEKRSKEIDQKMLAHPTDVGLLADLTKEKEELEAELEARMERYFELEEMIDLFGKNR